MRNSRNNAPASSTNPVNVSSTSSGQRRLTYETEASPPRGYRNGDNGNGAVDDSQDNISLLSDTSQLSMWSKAAMILRGENPEPIAEGDDEDGLLGITFNASSRSSCDDDIKRQGTVRWNLPAREGSSRRKRKNSKDNPKLIDFLEDPKSDMTYSRRVGLHLSKYGWYNPHVHDEEIPESELEGVGSSLHPVLNDLSERSEEDPMRTPNVQDVVSKMTLDRPEEAHAMLEAYPFTHSRRENPSLEKAWAYFDHVALSRYVLHPKAPKEKKNILYRAVRKVFCKGNQLLQRAEPGEQKIPTRLYSPVFTPHAQLGDFGLGIGLYFSTLRAITIMTLFAGLINIPNIMYFSSNEYNRGLTNFNSNFNQTIIGRLQGSAICTDMSWVVCESCNDKVTVIDPFDESRIGDAVPLSDFTSDPVQLYLKNHCEGTLRTAMFNYGTLIFVMLGTVALSLYLKRMEVAYDEDEQTAQDYSIVIQNPPGDATDPQEWHNFFRDAFDAHVTACTVAVDNDLLVRSLVERREKLRQIEMALEPGTSLDTLTMAGVAAKQERARKFLGRVGAMVSPGIPELFARVHVLTAKVQGLAQQDYPATNVFICFEREADQRAVLSALNLGSMDLKRNNTSKVAEQHLFRGKYVLAVQEPDEPNTVRWEDLNEKFKDRMKQQAMTLLVTCVAIFLIAVLVNVLNGKSNEFSAFGIAIFNSIFPMFAKILTATEAHSSEGGKQRSLYFKIALFRWVNTAVVITIITPFTDTVANGSLINKIDALFFAEIVTTNAIQLLDPMGHIERHILAPRASTQDAMNLKMQGAVFELAERYTNMTKILFLALWYCAVYPSALFMCSFALFINYFTDRFALMRTWKRPPQIGTSISEFSRQYFFSLALVAMAVISSYYWAGFPYDNLCLDESATTNATYSGIWSVTPQNDNSTSYIVTIPENTDIYKFCQQDFFRFPTGEWAFPFVSELQREGQEWMTDEQAITTDIYGWSAVGVVLLVVLSFFYRWYHGFMSMFRGTYEATGEDQNINFSDVPSISSYVPEVSSSVFSYPLVACNIDNIDKGLLEWTDPDRPHSFYDLTKDAAIMLRGTDVSSNVVFSQVAHWPPPQSKKQE